MSIETTCCSWCTIFSAMSTSLLAGCTHIAHQFVQESQPVLYNYTRSWSRYHNSTSRPFIVHPSRPGTSADCYRRFEYVLHPDTCHELLVSNSLQTQPALGNDNPVNPNGHLSEHTFLSCDWVSICDWWQTPSRARFQEPFWYSAFRSYRSNAAPHPNFSPREISSISFI